MHIAHRPIPNDWSMSDIFFVTLWPEKSHVAYLQTHAMRCICSDLPMRCIWSYAIVANKKVALSALGERR